MIRLRGYLDMVGVAALLGAAGYVWALEARNEKLTVEKAALTAKVATCEARKININEDRKSDAEIDAIPDADLSTAPDRWMRPEKP